MRCKITVAGTGRKEAAVAQRLAERDYADLVLMDPGREWAQGVALDLAQAGALGGWEPALAGATDWEEAAGSTVVVLAADGGPKVVEEIAGAVSEHCPDAVVVVVGGALDAMCALTLRVTGFPRARVVGMGGVLDSARFRTFLAWELGVSSRDVSALVLGAHGETMVPLVSSARVGGIPVTDKLAAERVAEAVRRTRAGEEELAGLLGGSGIAHGPAAGVVEMVDAIALDRKRVLPCSTRCQGEFGLDDVHLGVPVRLGREGVEEIMEMHLAGDERAALEASAQAVREQTARL